MIKVAKMLSQFKHHFTGFLVTVDNIPPYILFFPFAPESYVDDWEAEFEEAKSPGSRYSYPIFKGCSMRKVQFVLRFDAAYPVTTEEAAKMYVKKVGNKSNFFGYIKQSHDLMVAIAILEKLKLPKQGLATIAQGVLGGFTKVRPGVSDPAPPLTLLAVNPTKFYVGYFTRIRIQPLKYNKWMFPTRLEADCEFLVSPDYIFTTLEDALREVNAILGWLV